MIHCKVLMNGPVGSVTEAINQMIEDLNAIEDSALAPWQKIEAVATFINPRIEFIARGGFVFKTLLYPVDKLIKKLAKRWFHLPQRASAEVVFLLPSQGGVGLLPLVDGINIATVHRPTECSPAETDSSKK